MPRVTEAMKQRALRLLNEELAAREELNQWLLARLDELEAAARRSPALRKQVARLRARLQNQLQGGA